MHRHDRRKALCEECGLRIAVASVLCHPDYDPSTFDSNIAILVLAESVPEAYDVDNVVLDHSGTFEADATELIVAGWGTQEYENNTAGPPANTTMAVEVEAISTTTCTSDSWSYSSGEIRDSMMCAGYRTGTPRDACTASCLKRRCRCFRFCCCCCGCL